MAYTPPTAADLKLALPAFAAVDDAVIEFWLTQAAATVDESWTEADFAMGRMLYAAHEMTLSGLGSGTEAQIAATALSGVKTVRSGALSIELSGNGATGSGFNATSYGQRFLALLKRNRGGPIVVPTGTPAVYAPAGYPPLYREGE